jgi:hypothetical protein
LKETGHIFLQELVSALVDIGENYFPVCRLNLNLCPLRSIAATQEFSALGTKAESVGREKSS